MIIIKKKQNKGFTTVNNDYLRDSRLSWKAKGLITYIMSLPEDWKLNIADLSGRATDGRDSVAAGLREIIEKGYCVRTSQKNDRGRFTGYEYIVSDQLITGKSEENAEKPKKTPRKRVNNTENPKNKENPQKTRKKVQKNAESPKKCTPKTSLPYTENPFTENPALINTNNTKDLVREKNIIKKETRKTLFRNSEIFSLVRELPTGTDYSALMEKFNKPEYQGIDIAYYFHCVADWSDSSGTMRTANGWLATMRTFMRRDKEDGKLKMVQADDFLAGALKYLKNEF